MDFKIDGLRPAGMGSEVLGAVEVFNEGCDTNECLDENLDNDEVLRDNEVVAVINKVIVVAEPDELLNVVAVVAVINKVIPVAELDELLNVVAVLLDDEGEDNPGIVSLPGLYFVRS